MERYSRVLEERFWRGNEKGLFDLGLLLLSDLPLSLFIPRSKEAAEGSKVRPNKFLKSVNNKDNQTWLCFVFSYLSAKGLKVFFLLNKKNR